ncbi:hypothetical protein BGX34_011781 [Mortierella sp. NVP85]|nr:hypothetical protein BGX34_011781 [Mortierella sp. NVP85]
MFELRVNKSVCHFVTIIVRTLGNIQVFFIIFAAGIIAFAIAILHILHGSPVGQRDTSNVTFPLDFYQAISTTYFFMGGIWDSASNDFEGNNWPFQTLMMIYFFFTTILLLNLLISLISSAFDDASNTWELVWLDNKLRYIERAETITYNIPGYRESSDWFPSEIYYCATFQNRQDYKIKYPDAMGGEVVKQGHEELKEIQRFNHEEQKQNVEKMTNELKNELAGVAKKSTADHMSVKAGHEELRRMQTTQYEEQGRKIEDMMKELKELKQELKHEKESSRQQLDTVLGRLEDQRREFKDQLDAIMGLLQKAAGASADDD